MLNSAISTSSRYWKSFTMTLRHFLLCFKYTCDKSFYFKLFSSPFEIYFCEHFNGIKAFRGFAFLCRVEKKYLIRSNKMNLSWRVRLGKSRKSIKVKLFVIITMASILLLSFRSLRYNMLSLRLYNESNRKESRGKHLSGVSQDNEKPLKHLISEADQRGVVARRFPYLNDPECRNLSFSLYEDGTFNITALVSYPGSGNTWTRHLIHLASGVFTGSFYFDIELLAGGFLGEKETWYSGSTIMQKFHEKYNPRFNINKAILLLREPIPAIMSFANYLEAGHTGTSYRLPYTHKDWPNFLLQSTYNWIALAKSWLESPVEMMVIYYEHVRLNPVENVRKMCNFINHECSHLTSNCFQKKLEGSFRRTSTRVNHVGKQRLVLPREVMDIISRGIDYLNALLLKNRHEPMPVNLYKYYTIESKVLKRS